MNVCLPIYEEKKEGFKPYMLLLFGENFAPNEYELNDYGQDRKDLQKKCRFVDVSKTDFTIFRDSYFKIRHFLVDIEEWIFVLRKD